MTAAGTSARSRGRPREFNLDQSIDDAITVFRQRGFAATSMSDLMAGTGLSGGSLYKAFKDKKSLFLAAYDRYASRGAAEREAIAAGEGTGKEKLRLLLKSYAAQASGEPGRLGCLVVATAVGATTVDEDIAQRVIASFERLDKLVRSVLRQGIDDGSLPPDVEVAPVATTVLCLMQGMRVVAKSDKHRGRVAAVVDQAMKLVG